MQHQRKIPTERIEVTDQVGKRHVVVKYTEYLEASPGDDDARSHNEAATEYRLETGRSVKLPGADTFETTDGMLRLTALRRPARPSRHCHRSSPP